MNGTRWLPVVILLTAWLAAPGVSSAQNFPSQGGQPQSARSGFYKSSVYGFSLEYGPTWLVDEYIGGPDDGIEGIAVTNGASHVSFIGFHYSNTPQELVQAVADTFNVQMIFLQAVVDEPDSAAALYVAEDTFMGARIHAVTLSPSTAIVVVWTFPAAIVEYESDDYDQLVSGLRL